MRIVNLIQGTPEWAEHRRTHWNASDAPAMMGVSPYKSRNRLIEELATGVAEEPDAARQRLFDSGHDFEAKARPIAEQIVGEKLYPVVGVEDRYSASFDGLTMDESIAVEHKSLNEAIRACRSAEDLPLVYRVQMEHQAMVSRAERVLFLATKWAGDTLVESVHFWYLPDQALRVQIVAGWAQLALDVAEYKPAEIIPALAPAETAALPALAIQITGALAVRDNLTIFGDALRAYIERINQRPQSDQDFHDLDAAAKALKTAEERLETAESNALAQTGDIDALRRQVAEYRELARKNRLFIEKIVKNEKERRRQEIVDGGKKRVALHVAALNSNLGRDYIPLPSPDFGNAIRGLKTIDSLQNAVDTLVASTKITLDALHAQVSKNLAMYGEECAGFESLFPDLNSVVLKPEIDFYNLAKLRIAEHRASEAARAEREAAAARAREAAEAERQQLAAGEAAARQIAAEHAATQTPEAENVLPWVSDAPAPKVSDDELRHEITALLPRLDSTTLRAMLTVARAAAQPAAA